ncbi:MAG: asparagine synthase (glutamine-hydrolyzing) [Rhodobacteraceae bacterium]|nr:asparagine synthase (glutamine-hydrolyzing) [Paracoccaceae bacterium]
MCGIAGLFVPDGRTGDIARTAAAMGDTLAHRGPDDGDVWADPQAGIALAHRRLAVVDLSPAGRQPMHSGNGRYVICYNGEVYNHAEMRAELEARGHRFRGQSDTETMLAGIEAWGLYATLSRLVGMFAFALWDREARALTLVRDRLGIKPLYWSLQGGQLIFGSELKALRAVPGFDDRRDPGAVLGYLRLNCIGGDRTIYAAARKLLPGQVLTIGPGGAPELSTFWRLADVVAAARADPFQGSEAEAETLLHDTLIDAVGCRMLADVPLGAFLSGGIDSSTVVALMQAQSPRPVKTFSIGFDSPGFNEADHARAVAAHLGTDHTEVTVTEAEARDVIPLLPAIYDEPFADSSQIPTYLVSKIARAHVTVALSGDGGDELFAGYSRHVAAERYARTLFAQPKALRRLEAGAIRMLPPAAWTALARALPASRRPAQAGLKAYKLAGVLEGGPEDLYRRLVSHWDDPGAIVRPEAVEPAAVWGQDWSGLLPDPVERMQFMDTLGYLPDDILTKVDRASMAVALEARVPLLDHRVVALSWRLPKAMKLGGGQGKAILRRVLHRYVPRELVGRPKMGFGVPLGAWLRGPLRDWAGDLLSDAAFARSDIFAPEPIRQKWQEHLSGRRDWEYLLWDVLMYQAWDAAQRQAAPARLSA